MQLVSNLLINPLMLLLVFSIFHLERTFQSRWVFSGSTPGGTNAKEFTRIPLTNFVVANGLRLINGTTYFVTIEGNVTSFVA